MRRIIISEADRQDFIKVISRIELDQKRRYVAEWVIYRKKRTLKQNAMYHVWLECIHRTEIGGGYTIDELKTYFQNKFGAWYSKVMPDGSEEIIHFTSSQMNTKQMAEYLDMVQKDAMATFGADCRSPSDPDWEGFYNENRSK
jgi:hypothetical protein